MRHCLLCAALLGVSSATVCVPAVPHEDRILIPWQESVSPADLSQLAGLGPEAGAEEYERAAWLDLGLENGPLLAGFFAPPGAHEDNCIDLFSAPAAGRLPVLRGWCGPGVGLPASDGAERRAEAYLVDIDGFLPGSGGTAAQLAERLRAALHSYRLEPTMFEWQAHRPNPSKGREPAVAESSDLLQHFARVTGADYAPDSELWLLRLDLTGDERDEILLSSSVTRGSDGNNGWHVYSSTIEPANSMTYLGVSTCRTKPSVSTGNPA